MAAPQSIVRVGHAGTVIYCQVEGWGTMAHSLPLRRYAEQGLEAGASALRIDLHNCQYMDSTFLGTLIWLSRNYGCRQTDGFALIAPSPECRDLLQKMKLDCLLAVHSGDGPAEVGWLELSAGDVDPAAFQRCVIQAHQELANVPGPGKRTFHNIAEALSKELEAESQR